MECASCEFLLSLSCTLQKQEQKIKELEDFIEKQAQTILDLQSRITELEAQLGLNSENSSFPPFRDLVPPPKPISLRKQSSKKAGGQKNVKE